MRGEDRRTGRRGGCAQGRRRGVGGRANGTAVFREQEAVNPSEERHAHAVGFAHAWRPCPKDDEELDLVKRVPSFHEYEGRRVGLKGGVLKSAFWMNNSPPKLPWLRKG